MVFARGPSLSRAERDAVARFRERQANGGTTPPSSYSGGLPPADAVQPGCGLSVLLERMRETSVFESVFARDSDASADRRPAADSGPSRMHEVGSRLKAFADPRPDGRARPSPGGSRLRSAASSSFFKGGRHKAGDPASVTPDDSYDAGARADDAYFHDLMHDGE